LVIYDGDIHDQIEELEIDADFVVCLPDNGRDDLSEEIPNCAIFDCTVLHSKLHSCAIIATYD